MDWLTIGIIIGFIFGVAFGAFIIYQSFKNSFMR